MHGQAGEEEEFYRRQHMWSVHAPATPPPATSATPVVLSANGSANSFHKDGRKITVGDCALFQSGNSPPFIGIIRWFSLSKGKLGVNWLYRPSDVKLAKGVQLEAAPNEIFYSFHRDEISAESLLHPCKVAFLRKGVELPSGVLSFVCRRVYDVANKCLWWLTDKDYINERQEEVDRLLDKTELEMHAAVQSGGRSPKTLNGHNSAQQLKTGSESVQNSGSPASSQVKGKKRDRADPGLELVKQDRTKSEDGEPGNVKADTSIKSEISRITDKGGLTDAEGVEKLLSLMQFDKADKKIDFPVRIMLADVIAATDRYDCLLRFVQQRGVLVLDDWLQEAHKGKNGDGSSPKDSDKSVDELLLALLRALDKLPVTLNVLQTSNVGKSVNNLRGHKNLEVQKKARNLVDTWKKRVDAEMKLNDSKSAGSSPAVSWSGKQGLVDGAHGGNRRSGSSEVASKTSVAHPSHYKTLAGRPANGDSSVKSTIQPGYLKSPSTGTSPLAISSKEAQAKLSGAAGISEAQMSGKDDRSSGSSQSHNNSQSCSSDHAKNMSASLKEDARSSTAGSMNFSKSSSSSSRHRKPSNGLTGAAVVVAQKEAVSGGKPVSLTGNVSSDKVSQSGVTGDRLPDPLVENGNSQRLIVRLPNPGRCPTQSASSSSFEEPPVSGSRASSPVGTEKHDPDEYKKKVKGNNSDSATDANAKSSLSNHDDKGVAESDESGRSPTTLDEEPRSGGNVKQDIAKGTSLSVAVEKRQISSENKSGNSDAPFNPINALIESCDKYSDASAPFSTADDIGMNLLASVATGEIAKSGSPDSPSRSSPTTDDHSSAADAKSKVNSENAPVQNESNPNGGAGGEPEKYSNVVGNLPSKMEPGHTTTDIGVLWKPAPISPDHKSSVEQITEGDSSESNSPGGHVTHPLEKEGSSEIDKSNQSRVKRKVSEGMDDGSAIARKKTSPLHESISINSVRPRVGAHDLSKSAHCDRSLGDDGEAAHATSSKMPKEETGEEIPLQNLSETDPEKQDVGAVKSETSVPLNEKCFSLATVGKNEACYVSSGALPSSSSFAVVEGIHVSKSGDSDVTADKSESSRKEQVGANISTIPLSTASAKEQIKEEDRHSVSVSCQEQIVLQSRDFEQDKMPVDVKLTAGRKEAPDLAPVDAESLPTTSGRDSPMKCEFDLNEGVSGDEANQGEPSTSAPIGCPSTVPMAGFLPFNIPAISSLSVPITVAAPAKGPFRPPETLLKSKSEVGWKGSAATSAFRPAEPRKVLEIPVSSSETSSETVALKQNRPILDFDLNVPDDRVLQETTSERSCLRASFETVVLEPRDSQQRSVGGLDLDLNRADEGTESAQLSTNIGKRPEIPNLVARPTPVGFPNGEVSASREFDLNNGPGLDEGGGEPLTRSHHPNTSAALFIPPVPPPRMNNPVLGSLSSWFPPGNSYSTVAIPQYITDRGDHCYSFAGASGTQSYLANTTGAPSFSSDLYRAPVLTSPAMAFPSYPTFPFGPSFPLGSASFSGAPATFVESSSGAPGFAPIPAQLPGAAAAPSAPYLRPILISLPDGTTAGSSGAESSRKWVRQGLDLNAGPGSADAEGRDERLLSTRQQFVAGPQAFADEQATRAFQLAGGGLKRKEPEGGWEAPRFPYRQPSRQ